MCVHIQGASPTVTISFRPKANYQVATPGGPVLGPLAFTPYVVSRNMVAKPSISANSPLLHYA